MKIEFWRSLVRAELLSPKWLIARAALLCALFALVHLLGWREYTSFVSGTVSTAGWQATVLMGGTYILFYLGFVFLVPILLIAGVLLILKQRFWSGRPVPSNSP